MVSEMLHYDFAGYLIEEICMLLSLCFNNLIMNIVKMSGRNYSIEEGYIKIVWNAI